MAECTMRRANVGDKKAIYDLLKVSYYEDMPLFPACNINEPPLIDEWPSLQELDNGLTVVAISGEEIVGVAINGVPNDKEDDVKHPGSIQTFVDKIDQHSTGLLSHLEKTTMELRIMCVARHKRGHGIAKKLITETENAAKEIGRSKVFAVSTGAYMETAFRRQNWTVIYTFLYDTYHREIDKNFKIPPLPHDCLTILEKAV